MWLGLLCRIILPLILTKNGWDTFLIDDTLTECASMTGVVVTGGMTKTHDQNKHQYQKQLFDLFSIVYNCGAVFIVKSWDYSISLQNNTSVKYTYLEQYPSQK
jgi:hypothetical protein